MYLSYPGGPAPTPGGCLTQWHVHTNLCIETGSLFVVGQLTASHPTCPAGSSNRRTPPILHVWFVPLPGGPLAIDAPNTTIVNAAERVPSPNNRPA